MNRINNWWQKEAGIKPVKKIRSKSAPITYISDHLC